jgi:hypothetical protein
MWSLRFLDDGTAHLVLGSFVTWQMKLDWKVFLAEAFGAMRARGNPGLVLDVRGNEGGSDEVLLELARYLVWKPVELPARRSLVRYRRLPPDLGAHLDTWDESFRDFGEDAAPRGDGFFELRSASRAGRRLEPGPDAYRGRIVLLVDAANSSATFTLASVLKDGGLATLVGQPTGGSRRGLNGGKIFFLRLPGSGIEVDVPVVGTFPLEEQPDEGVRPDVLVEPSVEDVLAGRDAALAAAQASLASPPPGKLVDLVHPIVGTARKDQAIGAVNSGQTFPAVGVPFGMTHWTPQTQPNEDKCVSPLYAQDERIHGIRAGHVVARVDAPLDGWGTWGAGGVREGAVEQPGRGDVFGGWARLRVREGQVVFGRAGTSRRSSSSPPSASTRSARGRRGTRSEARSSRSADRRGRRADVHRPGPGRLRGEPLRAVGDARRPAARAAVPRPRRRRARGGPGAAHGTAPEPRLGRPAGGVSHSAW